MIRAVYVKLVNGNKKSYDLSLIHSALNNMSAATRFTNHIIESKVQNQPCSVQRPRPNWKRLDDISAWYVLFGLMVSYDKDTSTYSKWFFFWNLNWKKQSQKIDSRVLFLNKEFSFNNLGNPVCWFQLFGFEWWGKVACLIQIFSHFQRSFPFSTSRFHTAKEWGEYILFWLR